MSFMKFFRKNRKRVEKSAPEPLLKEKAEEGKTAVVTSPHHTPQPNLSHLRQRLIEQFSEDELDRLAQQLDVHYSLLPGVTKEAKARELITHLQRRGRLDELETTCQELKPDGREQTTAVEAPPSPTTDKLLSDRDQTVLTLLTNFNLHRLRLLCYDLQVDFDQLPGETIETKASALIKVIDKRGYSFRLIEKIRDHQNFEKAKILAQVMRENLSEVELREVAFDLGVKFADLSGSSFGSKVRELVQFAHRRMLLDDLLTICQSRCPDINWKKGATGTSVIEKLAQNPPDSRSVPRPPIRLKAIKPTSVKVNHAILAKMLRENFTNNDLRELCFELGLDYEWLPGSSLAAKSRELVSYIMNQGSKSKPKKPIYFSDLLAMCQKMRSDIDWSAALDEGNLAGITAVTYYPHGYDIANLRKLLLNTFGDDQAFTVFCNQHFPQIQFSFGAGMSFREKVQILLEYAQRRSQFQTLLEAVAETYPEKFAQYGPYEVESSS